MKKHGALILGLSSFTIVFLIITFFLLSSLSTIVIINTVVLPNNITSNINTLNIPVISFLSLKPQFILVDVKEQSQVYDIRYKLYDEKNKLLLDVMSNQVKADSITIRLPYSVIGKHNGKVIVEIPKYNYIEEFKIG